jgi:hypothetical protein
MAAVDRMLEFQREAQHAQIKHLIEVKNLLTETQQAQLAQLRDAAESRE